MTNYTIASGTTSNGLNLSFLDTATILSGGTLDTGTLFTGAEVFVESGGSAENTLIFGASSVDIEAGGSAVNTVIDNGDGGEQLVEGTASGTSIDGGCSEIVESGGISYNPTIQGSHADGIAIESIGAGGTVYSADILSMANQDVYSGGQAIDSVVYSGGSISEGEGGTIANTTINSGGKAQVGGLAIDSTINSAGNESIFSAGILDSAMIDGGTEIVSGTIDGTIGFSGTGGILELGSSAIILGGTEFTGFAPGDTIILEGVTGSAIFNTTSGILTVSGTDLQFAGVSATETFVSTALTVSGTASTEITIIDNAECFLAGTRIMTPHGAVAVENLELGDEVLTAAGKAELIEWIGQRSYDVRFAVNNHLVRPVCITADALAAGVPTRDLYVSPGHGIFIDGVLVPAWRLINGKTVTQPEIMQAEISYYHIELASHAAIMAENCPAETYLDIGSRSQFQNAATCSKRVAALATPLPRVESGFALETIKAKLNGRAGVETRSENTASAVTGHVEHVGLNTVSGWVLCPDDPETPVCLDVYFWLAGTLNRKRELANIYRADLRNAGLGSGCHGFAVELPEGATGARVVRSADRTPLALIEAATQSTAAA